MVATILHAPADITGTGQVVKTGRAILIPWADGAAMNTFTEISSQQVQGDKLTEAHQHHGQIVHPAHMVKPAMPARVILVIFTLSSG